MPMVNADVHTDPLVVVPASREQRPNRGRLPQDRRSPVLAFSPGAGDLDRVRPLRGLDQPLAQRRAERAGVGAAVSAPWRRMPRAANANAAGHAMLGVSDSDGVRRAETFSTNVPLPSKPDLLMAEARLMRASALLMSGLGRVPPPVSWAVYSWCVIFGGLNVSRRTGGLAASSMSRAASARSGRTG
jgi:hypothetical protein